MDPTERQDEETLGRLICEAARYLGVSTTDDDALKTGTRLMRTLKECKQWRDERLARASDR